MKFWTIALFLSFQAVGIAQSDIEGDVRGFNFGPKVGPTIGFQNWNGVERNAMLNFHFDVFIESLDPNYRGALYAQFGLKSRGSAIRYRNNLLSGSQAIVFRNLSLELGAKKRLLTDAYSTPYYFAGIRAEYNLGNNLDELFGRYEETSLVLIYPIPGFENTFTYGISFGGGIEFVGNETMQPALQVSISPDLSPQYRSPAAPNIKDPFTGNLVTIEERNIRNITLEVSFILKFRREITYID